MNPYDFVRIDLSKPPELKPFVHQDRFSGMTGTFSGVIRLLTPTFIKDSDERQQLPLRFARNRAMPSQFIIPGSSLKGMFRSVVETVGNCWWWFYGRYSGKFKGEFDPEVALPSSFRNPGGSGDLNHLDAACRLFGFTGEQGSKSLAGSVGFDDAICTNVVEHKAIYTPIHDSPKPRHTVWYAPGNKVAGRKFYFHHKGPILEEKGFLRNKQGENYNSYIKPLGPGSEFTFSGHFTSVMPADLQLLLYAIVLEPTMRHKIGFGKAFGLGSIEVKLTRVRVVDVRARYAAGGGGFTEYTVDAQIQPFTANTTSVTLNDLRRIWQWPPVHRLAYPGRDWFRQNPTAAIADLADDEE